MSDSQDSSVRLASHDGPEWMSHAVFSACDQYRFLLTREWVRLSKSQKKDTRRFCMFIGLNPSTATEAENDPTVRRCIDYAQRWGFDAMWMMNAFALRSTDPKGLKQVTDPNGTLNDQYILNTAQDRRCHLVIPCWGNHASLNDRSSQIYQLLNKKSLTKKLKHFGLTKHNQPKHPLYLRKDLALQEWIKPSR